MTDVVIVSAARTPIGALGGSLKDVTAVELGTVAAKAAIARSGLDAAEIDQAIIGNVLQANNGQNVARQIALRSGLDTSSTAMTVNEVCGSGLKAVRLGQAAIILGDADIVLVGGTESMSGAPYYAPRMRFGHKYGSVEFVDGIFRDGLSDAFTGQPMRMTDPGPTPIWISCVACGPSSCLTGWMRPISLLPASPITGGRSWGSTGSIPTILSTAMWESRSGTPPRFWGR